MHTWFPDDFFFWPWEYENLENLKISKNLKNNIDFFFENIKNPEMSKM